MDLAAATLDAITASVSAVGRAAPVADRLQRLVDLARSVGRARYAALGLAGPEGDFTHFVTSGMSRELVARIGPLPRTHGLLASVLTEGATLRSDDIGADPRFEWWPDAHPRMRAFLGVPVRAGGEIVAAYYLADREDGASFDDHDVTLIETLAAHTSVAVELSRLWDERLELVVLDDRNRLARELHDSVAQMLFSAGLLAEAAAETLATEPAQARATIEQVRDLTRDAATELRALIFELRPPLLEVEGLATTLAKHVDVLRRVHRGTIALEVSGSRPVRPRIEREVLRIAQEAVGNAVRHAPGSAIHVELTIGAQALRVCVRDDGPGFDPAAPVVRARHLGLTTMEERARALGGTVSVTSAPGSGTTVLLEVPVAA